MGQGVCRDGAEREDGEPNDPMDQQRVPAPRRGLRVRQDAHDAVRVVEGEALDRDAFHERVDVAVEKLPIVGCVDLHLHVVRVALRKLARGPELAHVAERDRLRRLGARVLVADSFDRAAHLVEVRPFRRGARAEQEGPRHVGGYVRAAQVLSERREQGAARFRCLVGCARREGDLRPRRRVERDPGVPVSALLVGVPCSYSGHGRISLAAALRPVAVLRCHLGAASGFRCGGLRGRCHGARRGGGGRGRCHGARRGGGGRVHGAPRGGGRRHGGTKGEPRADHRRHVHAASVGEPVRVRVLGLCHAHREHLGSRLAARRRAAHAGLAGLAGRHGSNCIHGNEPGKPSVYTFFEAAIPARIVPPAGPRAPACSGPRAPAGARFAHREHPSRAIVNTSIGAT
jgi:hypothetical protein